LIDFLIDSNEGHSGIVVFDAHLVSYVLNGLLNHFYLKVHDVLNRALANSFPENDDILGYRFVIQAVSFNPILHNFP
jgi:hypothetical protein